MELKRIDVLLEEYQACQNTRNHYDNIRWTIGSIFIAISLAIFGISFTNEVINEQNIVILSTLFLCGCLCGIFLFYMLTPTCGYL
jgi:hypothetical protein